MPTPLLIVTADIPFGELIRQSLEETGRFVVRVASDKEAAAGYVRNFKPELAFLDTCLTENELLKIGTLLRQTNPGILFVVVSEAGWHSALEELFPRDYLSKPFYLPDLLEKMEKIFGRSPSLEAPSLEKNDANCDLPWLSDVTRAAQHLTRLTLESSAQAALITRTDKLWAYAGQLPQPAARELADTLSRYWDHQEENDLVRFVRLASTNAEHMLYATRLAEGMVLALVFDAETPFSTIRTQASQLVHSLSSLPAEEQLDENISSSGTPPNSLTDILSNIPVPRPRKDISTDFGKSIRESRKESRPAIPLSSPGPARFNPQGSPDTHFKRQVETEQVAAPFASLEDTVTSQATTHKNKTRIYNTILETTQDQSSSPMPEGARKIILEPVLPAYYNLDYACLLVPRFPHHHMTGDLLDRLGEWVQEICIAFAWRLEYISVRPEYLQWIVNVPPSTAPGYVMRILRRHTSEKIFSEFPRFKRENLSSEFWAPGYLIMGGSQPPPAQLIKDFIAQTRQKQGIPQPVNQ
jgi:REP element-mobilizing transposase RayT/DNA-binding response OmpR family regulator